MMRRTGLVLVGLLLVLAGCATPAPAGPTPTPSLAGPAAKQALPITIARTGGLANVNQSIVIAADGSWVYTVAQRGLATGQGQQGQLPADQWTRLQQTVADPAFAGQLKAQNQTTACSDAFQYTVSVGDDKSTFTDCGRAQRPLVDQALKIVTDATPF